VRTTSIQIDDVVEALVKGRRIVGRVTDVNDGVVYFRPICPGAGWRHAKAREIVTHWRKTGRRGRGLKDETAPSDPTHGQLSFPGGPE
jgi:hypothetical protein